MGSEWGGDRGARTHTAFREKKKYRNLKKKLKRKMYYD